MHGNPWASAFIEIPLTPAARTLSPDYRGEGIRDISRYTRHAASMIRRRMVTVSPRHPIATIARLDGSGTADAMLMTPTPFRSKPLVAKGVE